jgi:hypothetical protein
VLYLQPETIQSKKTGRSARNRASAHKLIKIMSCKKAKRLRANPKRKSTPAPTPELTPTLASTPSPEPAPAPAPTPELTPIPETAPEPEPTPAFVIAALEAALDAVHGLSRVRLEAKLSTTRLSGVARELKEMLKIMAVYAA